MMGVREHLEDTEQQALMKWAALATISGTDVLPRSHISDYLFAIPNGGRRGMREAARLKKAGVKPGVSDLLLPLGRHSYYGFWLEMKKCRKDFRSAGEWRKAQSPAQIMWEMTMRAAGYAACVAYGWEEAAALLADYLDVNSGMLRYKCAMITKWGISV